MYIDYVSSILAYYQQRLRNGGLSPRLKRPTAANLKKECLAVCGERWERKDAETLRAFFGHFEQVQQCTLLIRKMDTDRLRPLSNYLRKRTVKTDLKNIELLAWLLNFPGRPFNTDTDYSSDTEPGADGLFHTEKKKHGKQDKQPVVGATHFEEPTTFSIPSVRKHWIRHFLKSKTWTLGVGLLLVTAGSAYFGVVHNRAGGASSGNNQCMVWQDDHYELTDCNQPNPGKLVLAADPERIKNFRKIGDAYVDTITARSIGQLWYLKKDNKLEYFTCRGMHPVFTDKALKPLSLYMYSKYIHPEIASNPQFSSARMR